MNEIMCYSDVKSPAVSPGACLTAFAFLLSSDVAAEIPGRDKSVSLRRRADVRSVGWSGTVSWESSGDTASRLLTRSAGCVPCLRRSGFAQAGRIAQRLNVRQRV